MHQITLLSHTDGTKSCIYHPEAISGEGIEVVSYPSITEELLNELRSESTTPKRVQEILNSLTNL